MTYNNRALASLADPTRLAVFELVAACPRSVADITRQVPVSQSAVSQHLKVLKEVQLVQCETIGRRNIYRVDPAGIRQMRDWLDGMWGAAMDAFADEINNANSVTKKDASNDKDN